jgi:hypothetical protein
MTIQYIDPLFRAWARMKHILFSPFDLGKWFALGFSAFLASLIDWPNGGGGGHSHRYSGLNWNSLSDVQGQVSAWISEHPFWMAVIIAGLILAICLWIVLTWLSSRGAFMFLDNVVHNRSLIHKPWNDFENHGNSLFLWRMAFGFVSLLVIGVLIAAIFMSLTMILQGDLSSKILIISAFALYGLSVILIIAFISKLLKDFVVPMMYTYGVSVNEAWGKFLPLFLKYPWQFILYGLFVIWLDILVAIGVVLGGLLTCCCGFIVLIIPYIGSVLMLPISVTFRAFSLEFLEQFGAEYKIFPIAGGDSPSHEHEDFTPVI